jgi:hypothetical protein
MNLKALIATAAVSATVFGGVATAEAKPHSKPDKTCKQKGKDGRTYELVQLVELGPGSETYDANSNYAVCYSSTLGLVADDEPAGN